MRALAAVLARTALIVIPAKAGIHAAVRIRSRPGVVGPRLRGDDVVLLVYGRRPSVIVVVMVAMIVMAAMAVAVHGAVAVGAAFGVEGALDDAHCGAEAAHHVGDDVVVADVDDASADLGGEMAVAEVPGDAGQRALVGQVISSSRSGAASTATMRPSSSRMPSPARSTGALARSSRNARPPTPVSAMRRRVRRS